MLKSALEKVVFFECRLDQLTSELERANAEISRLKADLAQAAQREVELKHELANAEARAGQARREGQEALERAEAARREREALLDKLLEAERIRMAGEQVEGIDLAAFIADLRAEVLSLRGAAGQAPASTSPPPQPAAPAHRDDYSSAEAAAASLQRDGRLGVTERDREQLKAAAHFETRSEETLFSLSLRELSSADPVARSRAALRLQSLGARAALPAVAAALNAEQSSEVICALLSVCAASGEPSVLPLVQARLGHGEVEVRLAALEAAVRLKDPECLGKAMDDPSARVRRRAAILASGGPQAAPVLRRAAGDADPSVRRVAALGLASLGGPGAEEALLAALGDADPTVRRAAARGLSRSFGPEVFAVADADPARRRREIRRLATAPARPEARAPVGEPCAPPPAAPDEQAASGSRGPRREPGAEHGAARAGLESQILAKVLSALRGQTEDELVRGIEAAPPQRVREVADSLVGQGRLVRRGQRFFVP